MHVLTRRRIHDCLTSSLHLPSPYFFLSPRVCRLAFEVITAKSVDCRRGNISLDLCPLNDSFDSTLSFCAFAFLPLWHCRCTSIEKNTHLFTEWTVSILCQSLFRSSLPEGSQRRSLSTHADDERRVQRIAETRNQGQIYVCYHMSRVVSSIL